jgi:hemoglobin
MEHQSSLRGTAGSSLTRPYNLSMTEQAGTPHHDANGITLKLIHDVVVEFYERARRDTQLGPVFEARVDDWEVHLSRMTDFWSAALLRTGRYSGRPVEHHRGIPNLTARHFDRWVELFAATVQDLCPPQYAEAFLVRAQRMRDGMTIVLGLRA